MSKWPQKYILNNEWWNNGINFILEVLRNGQLQKKASTSIWYIQALKRHKMLNNNHKIFAERTMI